MAFRFDISKTVPENAEEMLSRQLGKALRQLKAGLDADEAVAPGIHGARKNLKKARSLLKLLRPGLKRPAARRMNRALRDCGRALSGERDRTVGLETLDWLETVQREPLPEQLVSAVRKLYLAPSDPGAAVAEQQAVSARETLVDGIERADAIVCGMLPQLELDRLRPEHIATAYAAGYADGRDRFLALDILTAEDEDVHDLRKPVQRHWRQTALLLDLWPEEMTVRLETARHVSKLLGMDHDLSLLAERVAEGLHVRGLARSKADFIGRCRTVQGQLRREVRPWLLRLYGPQPAAWEETLTLWWEAAGELDARSAAGQTALFEPRLFDARAIG
jgi:hypothetical protein